MSGSSVIKPLVSEDKDKMLAIASLVEVGKFIPNIDTEKNFDLLPVAFNACVINRVNKNGDVIDTKTAISCYKEFVNKPINVEHNRQKVIGVILTAGFSKFGTDEPLTEAEASAMTGPFNIILGGIVWRMVSPQLSEFIEESNDPTSDHFESVSASWELGFSDYNIAIMSAGMKNLSEAQIITDSKEVDKLKSKLKALGGEGKEDDKYIYRMPVDVLPIGIGFTEKPAAEVKGVATQKTTEPADAQAQADEKTAKLIADLNKSTKNYEELSAKLAEALNIISQLQKTNVKTERIQDMKITSIQDITDENLKQSNAADVAGFIAQSLKDGSDKWVAEKGKLEKTIADTQAAAAKAQEDSKSAQAELEKIQKTVAELQKEKTDREAVEKFNSRMATLNEAYEFDDETRAAIVEDVKVIASDDDFAKYQKKASVLFKGFAKKKTPTAAEVAAAEEAKKKTAEAAQAAIDAAVNNGKQENGLPNGSAGNQPSLLEKYKTAFAKDQFIVTK